MQWNTRHCSIQYHWKQRQQNHGTASAMYQNSIIFTDVIIHCMTKVTAPVHTLQYIGHKFTLLLHIITSHWIGLQGCSAVFKGCDITALLFNICIALYCTTLDCRAAVFKGAILPHYRSTAITVINATTTRLRHRCLSSLALPSLSMHNSYLVTTIINGSCENVFLHWAT